MRTWVLAAAAMGLATGSARAAVVVYDNLGSAASSSSYATFGLIDGNQSERAMQFTATQTVQLSTLELMISKAPWYGRALGGTAQIDLVADASGTIGSQVIESWTSGSLTSTSPGVGTLVSAERPTLMEGTKYWLVMSGAAGSSLGGAWYFAGMLNGQIANVAWRSAAGQPITYYSIYGGFQTRVTGDYLPGDLTGDGWVDGDDYALIDRGYARQLTSAGDGDFNGDGVIDASDYLIIDTAYAAQVGGTLSPGMLADREAAFGAEYMSELAAAVPEPGVLSVVAVIGMLAGRRRP